LLNHVVYSIKRWPLMFFLLTHIWLNITVYIVTKYSCITGYIVTKYSCITVYIVTKYSCIIVYIVTKYSCITVYIVTKNSCITVYIVNSIKQWPLMFFLLTHIWLNCDYTTFNILFFSSNYDSYLKFYWFIELTMFIRTNQSRPGEW
jgi:hypothetical protein